MPSELDVRRCRGQDRLGFVDSNLVEAAINVENGLETGPAAKFHDRFHGVVLPVMLFAVGGNGNVATDVSVGNTTREGSELTYLHSSVSLHNDGTRAICGVERLRIEWTCVQRSNLKSARGRSVTVGDFEVGGGPKEQTSLEDREGAIAFQTEFQARVAHQASIEIIDEQTRPNDVPAHDNSNVGEFSTAVVNTGGVRSLVSEG